MLVENMMTSPVLTVSPDVSIYEALHITRQHRIRHLPVLEGNKLVGIVSDRDLRDACPSCLENGDPKVLKKAQVRKIMRAPVITVHPLDFFDEAVKLMYQHRVGCLPVVSGGKVVGIISETDLLHHLVDTFGILAPGSYLEVEIPNTPGALANVTKIIKNHEVNISCLLLSPAGVRGKKCLVMRVEAINIRQILMDIEKAGYRILWPVTTGG